MSASGVRAGVADNWGFDDVDPSDLRRRGSVRWTFHEPDVLPLSFAEMDFRMCPEVEDALVESVVAGRVGNTRTGTGFQAELAAAFAAFSAQHHAWDLDPECVRLVPGVLKGLELAIEAFTPAGSGIVLITPAYQQFYGVLRLVDRPIHFAPMVCRDGRFEMDVQRIDEGLAAGCGAVLLCNPHNPTGRVYTHAELSALARVVEARGARVIADEIHAPLVLRDAPHIPYATVSEAAAAHSITLTAAAKGWNLSGLPCGQVVLTNEAASVGWDALPPLASHGLSTTAVFAAMAAYREGVPWLRGVCDYLRGNADRIAERLPEVMEGAVVRSTEGTYMAWVDCTTLGVPDPSAWLEKHARVSSFPGRLFSSDHENWIRLCFPTSRHVIDAALDRIAHAMAHR
ncbi:MAG: hypothetical protein JWR83_1960 [Aeromicrobium sp.]|nr:hypothetical protein [Aeromicrobium sp.]